jgi:hypothetical protein
MQTLNNDFIVIAHSSKKSGDANNAVIKVRTLGRLNSQTNCWEEIHTSVNPPGSATVHKIVIQSLGTNEFYLGWKLEHGSNSPKTCDVYVAKYTYSGTAFTAEASQKLNKVSGTDCDSNLILEGVGLKALATWWNSKFNGSFDLFNKWISNNYSTNVADEKAAEESLMSDSHQCPLNLDNVTGGKLPTYAFEQPVFEGNSPVRALTESISEALPNPETWVPWEQDADTLATNESFNGRAVPVIDSFGYTGPNEIYRVAPAKRKIDNQKIGAKNGLPVILDGKTPETPAPESIEGRIKSLISTLTTVETINTQKLY